MVQVVLHAFLLVVGWSIYFYYLSFTLFNYPDLFITPMIIIVIFIVSILIINFLWVWHNVHLYNKKEPRKLVPGLPTLKYEEDWEGQPIEADWEQLKKAKNIEVWIDTNKKKIISL